MYITLEIDIALRRLSIETERVLIEFQMLSSHVLHSMSLGEEKKPRVASVKKIITVLKVGSSAYS